MLRNLAFDTCHMTTADFDDVIHTFEAQTLSPVGGLVKPIDVLKRDQRIAVNANEALGKFALQLSQRVLNHQLTARINGRDVLVLCS